MSLRPRSPIVGPQALLADLSRLYFALRRLDLKVDYRLIADVARANGPDFRPLLGFTTCDAQNAKQVSLLDRLRSDGWSIHQQPPREAAMLSAPDKLAAEESMRFDAAIAFSLGRLAGHVKRVVVISDSYALRVPIEETMRRGTDVSLAFFEEELDPRWAKDIRTPPASLNFIELRETSILPNVRGGISAATRGHNPLEELP